MNPEQWRQLEETFAAILELSPNQRIDYLDQHFPRDNHHDFRSFLEQMLKAADRKTASFQQPTALANLVEQVVKDSITTQSSYETVDPIQPNRLPHQPNHLHVQPNHLHVQCPNCHSGLAIAYDEELETVSCNSCGTDFCLVNDATNTASSPMLSRLNQFELVERLGIGAFGAVWKARDTILNRTVALKIPRKTYLSNAETDQFFREAQSVAKLKHPNIVQVFEVGKDHESFYIASDFIRGVTLSDWLSAHRLTQIEAAKLCETIASALHHAHEQGVVHRDLKPGNIMMDDRGEPHIMDFGLAKVENQDVSMTVDGQILGTPAYMPPEQAAGKGYQSDRRADIYSLGVILFELLTNERPFRGNARMMIHQVLNEKPPNPRSLNSAISKDLEVICLRCLEKEPADRYQSSQDVAEELRRFLNKEPILARPVGRLTRAARWVRRNPFVAGLVCLVLATLILGAGLLYYQRAVYIAGALLTSDVEMTRKYLKDISAYRPIIDARLQAVTSDDRNQHLRACLGLLASDPSRADPLVQYVLDSRPSEFFLVTSVLKEEVPDAADELWRYVSDHSLEPLKRLRAACAVGFIETNWKNASHRDWQIIPQIMDLLDTQRLLVSEEYLILIQCGTKKCAANPYLFCESVHGATEQQIKEALQVMNTREAKPEIIAVFQSWISMPTVSARRKAVAIATITALKGYFEIAVDQLATLSREVQSHLIELVAKLKIDPDAVFRYADTISDPALEATLLLSLGTYDLDKFPKRRDQWVKQLLHRYESDGRYAIHGAIEFVLKQWGYSNEVEQIKQGFATKSPRLASDREWFVNSLGITFSCIDAKTYLLGSPITEKYRNRKKEPIQQEWKIHRRIAVATTEVRNSDFVGFFADVRRLRVDFAKDKVDCPIPVSWYDAVHFCNWLSEKEGLEPCYQPNSQGEFKQGMSVVDNYLYKTGYRLPTEAEWEYACRAGNVASRFYGDDVSLLKHYAWQDLLCESPAPVAGLKPNRYGLFDILGNVFEWTGTPDSRSRPKNGPSRKSLLNVDDSDEIVLRGGAFSERPRYTRSACGYFANPQEISAAYGFRLVRTLNGELDALKE